MATQDGINQDLYHKYNGMLEKQSEMNGYLKVVVESWSSEVEKGTERQCA